MRIGVLYFGAAGAFYMAASLLVTGSGPNGTVLQSDIDSVVVSQWDDSCTAAVAYNTAQNVCGVYNAKP